MHMIMCMKGVVLMDKEKTGQLIKEARIRNKLTQAELGDILGVTNKAISRWEKAKASLTWACLRHFQMR